MIVFIAMFATVACKDENTNPPPSLPGVTITAPDEILPNKTGAFIATLSEEAKGDITIKVMNANSALLSIAAEEIIIEKGKKEGKVDFTGTLNSGRVKISFTSTDATVKTPELTIMIPLVDSWPEYPYFENGTFSAVSKIVIGNQTIESSAANSPDGANKQLAGRDDFGIGGVSDKKKDFLISLTDGISYTIYYDNFTADDGIEMAVALYINWSDDFDFIDPGEEIIVQKNIPANAKKEISGTITIPENATKSGHIRVICYAVEGSDMQGGDGYADSGSFMEIWYTL